MTSNSRFFDKKEQQKLAHGLVNKTHFEKMEIEALIKEYRERTGSTLKMDRKLFNDFLTKHFDMTDDMMMDCVFRTFDSDKDSNINMEEWVKGMSVFLRGNFCERTKFCFEVYDLNGDGFISREEMFQLLKDCMKSKQTPDEDPEETKKDLVDIVLKLLTNESQVSLACFRAAVAEEWLRQECLGTCLPCDQHIMDFERQFFNKQCSQLFGKW